VNRAIVVVSQDGNPMDGDVQHVDADSSGTRFRFTGSEELDNGMTVGVVMEYGASGENKHNHEHDSKGDGDNEEAGAGVFTRRHSNVYLSSAAGKLTIGHASEAADGMAHARLGGVSWLGGVTNWCSYASMGPACPSNDGGRGPVLRYDTPAIGLAKIAASIGKDDAWSAKLSVAGSMGDSGYDFRVGYIDASETLTASGAFSMGQGTSVAVAWSQVNTTDHEYQYVELDQSYGDGSVGVYFKRGEMGGTDGTLWGVGVGHGLGGGATAYAGIRNIEADGMEDRSLFVAGMRVTFN
jgi:predicted porin